MRDTFARIKDKIVGSMSEDLYPDEMDDDYLEIDHSEEVETNKAKVTVKPYSVKEFTDLREILDDLRGGYTIGLVNIKHLKDKDLIELKRVVNKLKKTCDALDGDIAGFGENWIVVTPSFAQVFRAAVPSAPRNSIDQY
ncbi:MAG: cell division protein SepF [archaeon]